MKILHFRLSIAMIQTEISVSRYMMMVLQLSTVMNTTRKTTLLKLQKLVRLSLKIILLHLLKLLFKTER